MTVKKKKKKSLLYLELAKWALLRWFQFFGDMQNIVVRDQIYAFSPWDLARALASQSVWSGACWPWRPRWAPVWLNRHGQLHGGSTWWWQCFSWWCSSKITCIAFGATASWAAESRWHVDLHCFGGSFYHCLPSLQSLCFGVGFWSRQGLPISFLFLPAFGAFFIKIWETIWMFGAPLLVIAPTWKQPWCCFS